MKNKEIPYESIEKWLDSTYSIYLLFFDLIRKMNDIENGGSLSSTSNLFPQLFALIDKNLNNLSEKFTLPFEIIHFVYQKWKKRKVENLTDIEYLMQYKSFFRSILLKTDLYEMLYFVNPQWSIDIIPASISFFKTIEVIIKDGQISLLPVGDKEDLISFAKEILITYYSNRDKIDKIIADNLEGWELSRLFLIDRIILICGVAEKMAFPDIPLSILISEYLGVAQLFTSSDFFPLLNALLDKISKTLNFLPLECK